MATFRRQYDHPSTLAALIAAHFAATILAIETTVEFIGLREFPVVVSVVAGLLWGQAVLLGQFLVLGRRLPLLRLLLVAGWFASVLFLGQPIFRVMGGLDAFIGICIWLAMPFGCSVLIAAARRSVGLSITQDAERKSGDESLRFSLRHLFALIFLVAVTLAGVRSARDWAEEASQAVLFGLLPVLDVFVLLPYVSLWAALGERHPVLRSAAITLFGLISVVAPLFIGRAKASTYGMLVCPIVVPSVVVLGSLLMMRAIGYRYAIEYHSSFRKEGRRLAL